MTVGTTVALATALSVLLGANNATDTITATGGGYYKVVLPQASTLLLKLNSLTANLDLDVVNASGTVLTDANGQSLTSSNTGALPEQIEAYNLAAGTYYVHLKNPTNAASAPFRLTATVNMSPDLVWRNSGLNTTLDPDAGKTETWKMGGATSPNQVKIAKQSAITLPYFLDANWQVAGNGDFNQDGYNDLVWRNYSTGVNVVWLMNADGSYNQSINLTTVADTKWVLAGVDDFNNDAKPDLVWRYQGTGADQGDNVIWLLNGISGSSIAIASSPYITGVSDLDWRIGGTGDFNQDGKPDIIFQNTNAAGPAVAFWYMDGTTFVSSALVTGVTVPAAPWYVFGSGHFNNDAKPDLIWGTFGTASELHAVWTMDNTAYKAGYFLNPDNTNPNWVTRDAFPGWTAPAAIDEAGDTVAEATSLGSIGDSTFTYGGFVGGAGDVDVYSFTTTATKQVSLTAANLSTAAVNYVIKNVSNDATVATANSLTDPVGAANLPAGTYTITVSQASSIESRYAFTTTVANPAPVLVSTNAPGSDGLTIGNSITVGGLDYFLSIGNSPGLYKTDGTSAGTVKLSGLTPSFPYDLVQLGSSIFFTASDVATGAELYKTDGTVSGTVRVADIQTGTGSSFPANLTVLGTKVYFAANDGSTGKELWSSDGTAVGTTRVANINTTPVTTGVSSPDKGSSPSSLKVMGTSLYFAADDGTTGNELWQYNGTTTSQVKDLYTGADIDGIPFSANPKNLTVNGSNLYFSAYTPASGQELFSSDGC
ncbi:MAG: FG-GAP-like repeat-containing protein [Stenomitos frigidus ULC029]